MKKIICLFLTLALFVVVACKKTDNGKPIITLKGNNPDVIEWGSAAKYSDPGAVVTDAVDGAISYTIDSTVNMYSAGNYTITFTATDAAGNQSTATRTVIVDAALYLRGIFTVKNYIGLVLNSTYSDTLSLNSINNVLECKSFANYKNANLLFNMSGTSITVPQQTDTCGIPARPVTFSGWGSFLSDTAFNINYTIADSNLLITGHGEYKLN
jgi:hypothetical protein